MIREKKIIGIDRRAMTLKPDDRSIVGLVVFMFDDDVFGSMLSARLVTSRIAGIAQE
jgi:hypothetical protein